MCKRVTAEVGREANWIQTISCDFRLQRASPHRRCRRSPSPLSRRVMRIHLDGEGRLPPSSPFFRFKELHEFPSPPPPPGRWQGKKNRGEKGTGVLLPPPLFRSQSVLSSRQYFATPNLSKKGGGGKKKKKRFLFSLPLSLLRCRRRRSLSLWIISTNKRLE